MEFTVLPLRRDEHVLLLALIHHTRDEPSVKNLTQMPLTFRRAAFFHYGINTLTPQLPLLEHPSSLFCHVHANQLHSWYSALQRSLRAHTRQ